VSDPLSMLSIASGGDSYRVGWANGWRIPDQLTVAQWADQHRKLTKETSKEEGPWRTDRTPPLREIMESLSPYCETPEITYVKATQLGGTEAGNNWIGTIIDHYRGSILVIQPTSEMSKRWSRQRFDVMVEHTPALQARIAPPRSREAANTIMLKRYPGGFLVIGHAESAASLASMSCPYVFADEVDSYPLDVGNEGSPLRLALKRAGSFGRRRKILKVSSPKKLMGESIIWREYLRSDQRRFFVPCPSCDHTQTLEMAQVLPEGAYLCQHCGTAIPHRKKTEMLEAGRWVAKYPERTPTHRGYQQNSLYASVGLGPTWQELYREQQEAGDDPVEVKTFVTTRLAVPYESMEGKIEPSELQTCVEDWHLREIPRGVLMITAAVDVQQNRFHVQILGWSRGPQCWILDRAELPGSPLEPEDWQSVDEYLDRPLVNAFGVEMPIALKAVDSGNWADQCYAFVREHQGKGYIAVKGHNAPGKPVIGRPTMVDVTLTGRTLKGGLALYLLGTDTAKDTLLERLAMTPSKPPEARWFHLPQDLPDDWYGQVSAERRDPESGRWVKVRAAARNEDTDTIVYGYAAACHPRVGLLKMREADWRRLEDRYEKATGDLFAAAAASERAEREAPPPRKREKRSSIFAPEGWGL